MAKRDNYPRFRKYGATPLKTLCKTLDQSVVDMQKKDEAHGLILHLDLIALKEITDEITLRLD
jgi:hypothetical protein